MFMFLLSTLGRKEDIQQCSSNVNLHLFDVSYDQLKVLNDDENFKLIWITAFLQIKMLNFFILS